LLAGEERSGIACRTFRATVAALALATGVVTIEDLASAVGALEQRLADRADWLPDAADLLDRALAIDVIGDGGAIGALEQAALMLREAPRLRAAAWDAGDWLHTAIYTALPGHRAILFAGTAYDAELIETIHGRGGRVVAIGEGPGAAALRVPAARGATDLGAALDGVAVAELIAAELWLARPGP
jgi:fructoselysine-6-P-deglycase FrlB-like protein